MPEKEDNPELTELSLSIRMHGADALPASFIAQSTILIEDEVFRSEYDELAEIFRVLEEIPAVVRDACYHRIERFKGNSLLFTGLQGGSLVLAGVCGALAYWIVENTVGESFKDAYKQSELHRKLKALFLRRLSPRQEELGRRLNQRLFVPISDPKVIAQIGYLRNGSTVIVVDLKLHRLDDVPPTPRQWNRRNGA